MAASHGTRDPGGLCPGWLTYPGLVSASISLSLGKFPAQSCISAPSRRALSVLYHLSVTVVSPPELPQNKVVGFDALAGREQKRIILALEAGCPN